MFFTTVKESVFVAKHPLILFHTFVDVSVTCIFAWFYFDESTPPPIKSMQFYTLALAKKVRP
jgi:hypothetical protein